MRIRDWSSDVCSSELEPRGGERRLVAIDDQIPGDVGRSHVADRVRCLRLHVTQERERDVAEVRHVELTGDEGQHARRTVTDDGVLDPVEIGPALFPIRSEEHTSELQSLMRISYAVFCWK